MKIRFAAFAALCVVIAFLNPVTVVAQDISQAFLCDGVQGFIIGAPDWQPKPDGYSDTKYLVSYKSGNARSQVTSFYKGEKAYEAESVSQSPYSVVMSSRLTL
jgi:hypothetical protein